MLFQYSNSQKLLRDCGYKNGSKKEVHISFVTEPAKTGLICTSNYTHLMNHNFPCELASDTKLTLFIVLC